MNGKLTSKQQSDLIIALMKERDEYQKKVDLIKKKLREIIYSVEAKR